jgi:hypothetical protein
MKASIVALAIATATTMSLAPAAYAQTGAPRGVDRVMTMDTDKDGMISKKEFMSMMEAKFDAMDKGRIGRLTAAQVQQIIDETGKTYGYAN